MKRKFLRLIVLAFAVFLALSMTCYALTESEVEEAVNGSSKEEVSGNVFIWFLCAIAFMKVSQKIDSFMSSLGISVGRTGGSLMAEAMIAGRAIGGMFKTGGKFAGFGKSNSPAAGTAPAGKGGIFGGIGRKMTEGALGSVTGAEKAPGGMMASIGKKMFQNSLGKSGAFAAGVIGSVARGEINKMGTISGENGKMAMESYFGFNSAASVDKNASSAVNVEHGGSTTITSDSNINGTIGFDASGQPLGETYSGAESGSDFAGGTSDCAGLDSGANEAFDDLIFMSATEAMPVFSDIEMGGGRITGMETTADNPDGIHFAMYDAEKYAKPEGNYETVTAVDNSKWYKQYAQPAVERTPYMDTKGKVQYNEKIVQKIPKAPMRKDKM